MKGKWKWFRLQLLKYPWDSAGLTSLRQVIPPALIFCLNFMHKNIPRQDFTEINKGCPIESKPLVHFPPINQVMVIKLLIFLKKSIMDIWAFFIVWSISFAHTPSLVSNLSHYINNCFCGFLYLILYLIFCIFMQRDPQVTLQPV